MEILNKFIGFGKKENRGNLTGLIKIVLLILLVLIMSILVNAIIKKNNFFAIDKDKYQAVFLSNDQVYFGKLGVSVLGNLYITDVYYLSGDSRIDDSSSEGVNLIKLGGEVHGPEDFIYLNPDHVVFWENLKPDSVVVNTIVNMK